MVAKGKNGHQPARGESNGSQAAEGIAPGGHPQSVQGELAAIAINKLRQIVAIEPECYTKRQHKHARDTFHGVNTAVRAIESEQAQCGCEGD